VVLLLLEVADRDADNRQRTLPRTAKRLGFPGDNPSRTIGGKIGGKSAFSCKKCPYVISLGLSEDRHA
jgi:hypothetical protein